MRIVMNYGKDGLPLDLPDDWDIDVIEKKPMRVLPDPARAIQSALLDPLGPKSLVQVARGCKNACIVICDITRPVPNNLLLPPVVKALLSAGMPADCITVLVATGLHRPNEGDELKELIGDDWVLDTVNVVNHFARADDEHIHLGQTVRGTPVKIDRRFVEADLRIVIGLVEPHFMAGYSGGRKLITPGIAHQETITTIHSARFLEDKRAANCVLVGNPLHEEQLQIAAMVGEISALNVVIDDKRHLAFVNFGEIVQSHLEAVSYLRSYAEVHVPRKYKTVVTSAAGYPLDKTYYQTVKGMVGAMDLLEPGGNLFIVSECSEGMGSPEYVEAQKRLLALNVDGFLKDVRSKRFASIDEWQTEMQIKPMRIGNVYLFSSGLSDLDFPLTGVNRVESIEDAVRKSVLATGDTHIAVIPEGPYVMPITSVTIRGPGQEYPGPTGTR